MADETQDNELNDALEDRRKAAEKARADADKWRAEQDERDAKLRALVREQNPNDIPAAAGGNVFLDHEALRASGQWPPVITELQHEAAFTEGRHPSQLEDAALLQQSATGGSTGINPEGGDLDRAAFQGAVDKGEGSDDTDDAKALEKVKAEGADSVAADAKDKANEEAGRKSQGRTVAAKKAADEAK